MDFISIKCFSLLYKGKFDSMNYFFPFFFFFFFLFLFVLGFCCFFFWGGMNYEKPKKEHNKEKEGEGDPY